MNTLMHQRMVAVMLAAGMLSAGCGRPASARMSTGPTGRLLIYTARDKDEVARVVHRFEQRYPSYQGGVTVVTLPAQAALDRLRAEKANPQAGFLWGGTVQALTQAAAEGLLVPSTAANDALIPSARKDPQRRWYAEMLLPEVIVYNHERVNPSHAPTDWDDLVSPAFAQAIVIRDVMPSGTMRTIFGAMIARHAAATNSPASGFEWLRKLDANTVTYSATPDDLYFKLDRGVGTVTVWNLQDVLIQRYKNARPWSFVIPASGAPVLLDGVGVVNNPSSMDAAVKFENVLLDPDLQLELARDYYQIPSMTLKSGEQPAWLTSLKLKEMHVDWQAVSAHEREWIDYWSQNIKGRGAR